jgi:HAD superfamily hydrolase (TIGR01459 family)
MSNSLPAIPVLPSISALAGRYDAWLCDIWGVMHNGAAAFGAAGEACSRFRGRGGIVVLISNAPRPAVAVAAQLDRIGVVRGAYDDIITSGDVTRALLAAEKGKRIYHMGPERDLGVFEDAGVTFTDAARAELVVNTGLFDDAIETPDDYRERLAALRARDVPMICANPDLMVEKGDRLLYCAGALAQAYEAIGGRVAYAGKPHAPVYDMAVAMIARLRGAPVGRDRILAIGDGLRTDMAGAHAAGIDALFIPSLLHVDNGGAVDAAAIAALFDGQPFRPIAAQDGLRW